MPLLFVDLLGVRTQWAIGGRAAAKARFAQLEALITTVIAQPSVTPPVLGAVESDAAALEFATPEAAITFGANLYRTAFEKPRRPSDLRLWLRGALIAAPQGSSLRTTEALASSIAYIQRTTYSDELLLAIATEKSGIKGMRLIVDDALLTTHVRDAFSITVGSRRFRPFRRLNHSAYPSHISTGFSDVLWMTIDGAPAWPVATSHMSSMLRWAADDAEEFQHAASTQLVFNEVSAILASLT
jgi:hypothetical protein